MAAALIAPGAQAQDPPTDDDDDIVLPDTFAGGASASALDVNLVTPSIVPVPNLLDVGVVRGDGVFESSKQAGRASILYPGNGVVSGPNLVCGTFIPPNLPPEAQPFFGPILEACTAIQFPLSVEVDALLRPDAATEGAVSLGRETDPISLGAVGASAHAGRDGTRTEAQAGDLRVLGLPGLGAITPLLDLLNLPIPDATLVRIDGLTARTDQRIVGDRLVVDAEVTVTGVGVLGGLVRIGSIVSRSHVAAGGSREPERSSTTEIAGVEVAGVAAQITDQGLVLGDPTKPLGPLLQQLTSAVGSVLEGVGLRITTLPTEEGEENGVPFASSGGLVIEFITPLAGLPPIPFPPLGGDLDLNGEYGVRIQIGTTGARGYADSFDDGAPTTRPPTSTGGGTGTGGGSSAPPRGSSGSGGAGTPSPTGAAAPTPGPAAVAPETEPTGFLDDGFADRMALLYLSFTLSALALCLAPKLTLPARFSGARAQ
jgi:hypothetical protein